MKPKQILDKYGITFKGWNYEAQADTKQSLLPYIDKDCIIAYKQGFIGFIMIVRSARNHFAYIGIQKGIYLGGMDYVFRRCSLTQAIKLMGKDYNILNKDELNQAITKERDKKIFEGLKEETKW